MATNISVHHDIEISCVEGVSVELRHTLPKGWALAEEGDSFVVRGERGDDWEDELWRVVRFVAYAAFFSLRRTREDAREVRYEMVSSSSSGRGFRVEFILTPQRSKGPRRG